MSQTQTATPAPAASDFLNSWSLRMEEVHDAAKPGAARKLALVSAISGIVFTILYVVAYLLLERTPLGSAPDQEIIDYYADDRNLTLSVAGLVVMPFAGIAFLWFMVALRAAVGATGQPVSRALGHVQQAAGIVFLALLFVGTAALVATPVSIRFADAETDPIVARMLPTLGTAVLLFFAMRMAAIFVFTTSSIGKATGLVPGWFTWVGYAVGVALLLAWTLATWFALLFPAWVLVLSTLVLWRSRTHRHTRTETEA
jgi:hypothetical protein